MLFVGTHHKAGNEIPASNYGRFALQGCVCAAAYGRGEAQVRTQENQ